VSVTIVLVANPENLSGEIFVADGDPGEESRLGFRRLARVDLFGPGVFT